MKKIFLTCGSFVLSALALLGVGCSMSKYPADNFFDGQALMAARAIENDEISRLPELTEGLDLAEPGRQDMTLLWFAVFKEKFEAIKTLVQLGAEPEEHVVEGLGTAVAYALHHKDIRYLEAMLDGGLPVDHTVQDNTPLIQRAAGADGATLEHVKLLVKRGANLEIKDRLGTTALISAIDTNQPDRAIYLVEMGADVNAVEHNGVSVMWAVQDSIDMQEPGELRSAFEKLRELMIERGAQFPPEQPEDVRRRMKSQGMKVIE